MARQRAYLRDQRRNEPASPIGVIAVIVLLAILVLGIGGGLPRLLNGGSKEREPVGLLTPNGAGTQLPLEPSQTSATSQGTTSSALTTPPPVTERPGAQQTAAADEVSRSWANVFYARTPVTETYGQLVDRAEQYTTSELAATFSSAGDATYDALKADGGVSRVVSVNVAAPRPDTAPVDTPNRITRLVTVKVATTGKRAAQFDIPLLVTVVPEGNRWLVSAVDGGTGP
ncbi:hypothetical protein ACFVWG_24330 [Kribbella sp. NPDC058245]|uniref:hypothetical protein n=1 Tax=Kribbella sp. NPDC058245 TaxID=3346399 RepID=UPI0036E791A2